MECAVASSQHSSALPPTLRFGLTNARKSGAVESCENCPFYIECKERGLLMRGQFNAAFQAFARKGAVV